MAEGLIEVEPRLYESDLENGRFERKLTLMAYEHSEPACETVRQAAAALAARARAKEITMLEAYNDMRGVARALTIGCAGTAACVIVESEAIAS